MKLPLGSVASLLKLLPLATTALVVLEVAVQVAGVVSAMHGITRKFR